MTNYAIVGGGRLARHFSEYFRLLEIPHTRWTRDPRSPFNSFATGDAKARLRSTVREAGRVLLLVADSGIVPLLRQYPFLHEKQLIHCSGSQSVPGVAGAHPLMTFSGQLYSLETYRRVPFVLEPGASFRHLFPGLPNPHFTVCAEDKSRYHAMCVMAGNFTQLLWQGVSERFERDLELPAGVLHPYLRQLAENFISSPGSALTGPLTRGDGKTIERNLNALEGDPLGDLYTAFMRFYADGQNRTLQAESIRQEQAI
jgi:hypothetical protein